MNCQTSVNFAEYIENIWRGNSVLVVPKPNKIPYNAGFVIRHFAGSVLYDAVSVTDF